MVLPATIIYIEGEFCYLGAYYYSIPDEGSSGAKTSYDKIIIIKFKVRRYRITRAYKRSLDYSLNGVSFVAVSGLPMSILTVGVPLGYLI